MRRLILGFAGRTYHVVGHLMHWLIKYIFLEENVSRSRVATTTSVADVNHSAAETMCYQVYKDAKVDYIATYI